MCGKGLTGTVDSKNRPSLRAAIRPAAAITAPAPSQQLTNRKNRPARVGPGKHISPTIRRTTR